MSIFDCDHLLHPFQYDGGTNQEDRMQESPLHNPVEIDGRSLADLLHFLNQLSSHINYYDQELYISDWKPFFEKSLPFKLAEMARYPLDGSRKKLERYHEHYQQRPSPGGLQLYIHYFYHSYIYKINHWFLAVSGNSLPLEAIMEKTIRENLSNPLKEFLRIAHKITNSFCTKKLNTIPLLENGVWQTDITHLITSYDADDQILDKEKRMSFLLDRIREIRPVFENAIRLFIVEAENNLLQSLTPQRLSLQKNHTPHLGLLFSFLKLFQYVQKDLNALTRKHLDHFYKNILKLETRPATPDKAHVLFQIQKNLDKFLLEKDKEVKDGKDKNKAEIYFKLDDEIVVNHTKVGAVRTLFLNHRTWNDFQWIEGVYMAPDALKANGVDIDFTDDTKNFPTLGAKHSKYSDPETKTIIPYPQARLGFLLASPVLLLNEGKRTVNIYLHCKLEDVCSQIQVVTDTSNPCCEDVGDGDQGGGQNGGNHEYENDVLLKYAEDELEGKLNTNYYVITKEVLKAAAKIGIGKDLLLKLQGMLEEEYTLCYCPQVLDKVSVTLSEAEYIALTTAADRKMLSKVLQPQKVLNLYFSGEEEWIVPETTDFFITSFDAIAKTFVLHLIAVIDPGQPAVTFYNGENLNEDLGVQLPSAKVVLNDNVKILHTDLTFSPLAGDACCLSTDAEKTPISFYQLFRDIRIENSSKIDVTVCGLKNLIVQNDENLQDVNKPILPFGPRPKVGSSFYIGSKEIFCKNWQKYLINVEWKDKPTHPEYTNGLTKWYENYTKPGDPAITEEMFEVNNHILHDGLWIPNDNNPKPLFQPNETTVISGTCNNPTLYDYGDKDRYHYIEPDYNNFNYLPKPLLSDPLQALNVNTRNGFIKLTLSGIDFQHDKYAFVLARTLMALANIVDIYALPLIKQSITTLKTNIDKIEPAIIAIVPLVNTIVGRILNIQNILLGNPPAIPLGIRVQLDQVIGHLNAAIGAGNLGAAVGAATSARNLWNTINPLLGQIGTNGSLMDDSSNISAEINQILTLLTNPDNIQALITEASSKIDFVAANINGSSQFKGIPNEPYTPTIKSISMDYEATADITDITFIHLYPFKGTYKKEAIQMKPTMLPTFCDEGTLYLGLKELVPGNNLNLLFQLAEATSDSENEKATISWQYLDGNSWKLLRKGFEVIDDATEELTNSGIVKLGLPENMTVEHSVMPPKLHWIKASSPSNTQAIAEAIGIHPQAILTTFTNQEINDTSRLENPLEADKLKKLKDEKAQITKVQQPYPSFGGSIPEQSGPYYVRVSERLRHKDRAIQKWDYERILLLNFPEIYVAKCIGHSYGLNAHRYKNDFPMAPGYIVIAVIPDLEKLKAGGSFRPKVPVGALEEISSFILGKTTPFVRLKVMNPRYEEVRICLTVKLLPGKDENYYKEQLQIDIRHYLAPWVKSDPHNIGFGRTVSRSGLIGFLESRDYLDFILDIKMGWENKPPGADNLVIVPSTPRSILIAGNIDVCIKQGDCEDWSDKSCESKPIQLFDYCN